MVLPKFAPRNRSQNACPTDSMPCNLYSGTFS